ncbi:MAG: hypothetical protein A3D26_02750 [Candidatus Blackburnbacteria bacterium RIFCSPHIGHO2_02_FULL_44_20]|uniref:Uncharacterized protein n=1 Tax=Candidatus Blackburnbacteria bacterium RIFCSPHIGHO2_02_FULL_44_20 TaxID=1797516 RepID=A0A1G1V5Q1_9BACT|nr:MAG: hypothetical protein A3D26_02750 [Candidatus Blackburnbacteria bacterium RIFCSPHIGHO2_02_FULL_44_20]OGY11908.1 MAG: hypothetical protein A3E16_03925 [Candidatus Blackburnbacteria bacterium RIFCSPHIGHO2_12_FULL_44_25]OGY13631.1 MAG: hypothetical protein A3A62_00125 [Candidatus Blackburnbacteria bacterium RIFCSPLOWO2_01_FULL_44_43]
MSPEMGKGSAERSLERPEHIICEDCGRRFNLLHRSHLRVHGYTSQAEYRQTHKIDGDVPLNSKSYSDLRRNIQKQPENAQRSSEMGINWGLRRRVTLALLERQNLYTPKRASEITQIPLQTIHSAIGRKALPSIQLCLLISTNNSLANGGGIVKAVTLEDMSEFAQSHRPKYPRN